MIPADKEVWKEGSQASCQLSHGPAVLLHQLSIHLVLLPQWLLAQPGAQPTPAAAAVEPLHRGVPECHSG